MNVVLAGFSVMPYKRSDKIALPKNFIEQHPQPMLLVVVDGNKNHAVLGQQFAQQLQPRPHHAQPLLMPLLVVAVHRAVFLQPALHQIGIHIVVVAPALVAGVIRRVNVNAIHPPRITRHQRFERMQIIAMHNQVALLHIPAPRQHRLPPHHIQRPIRHRQMMRINDLFAFEIKNRHDNPLKTGGQQKPEVAQAVLHRRPTHIKFIRHLFDAGGLPDVHIRMLVEVLIEQILRHQ